MAKSKSRRVQCSHGKRKSRSRHSKKRVCASKRGRKVGQFGGKYHKAKHCSHGRRKSGACRRRRSSRVH